MSLFVVGPKPELKTQDDFTLGVYRKVRSMEESVGWEWKSLSQKRREGRGARYWGPGDIGASVLLPILRGQGMCFWVDGTTGDQDCQSCSVSSSAEKGRHHTQGLCKRKSWEKPQGVRNGCLITAPVRLKGG